MMIISNSMQPKPTYYSGMWFQSRAEARWAFMFDRLGVPWQYEIQTFYLDDGWYKPDFYLPEFLVEYVAYPSYKKEQVIGLWIEIKGYTAGLKEKGRCQQLAKRTQKPMLFAKGIPGDSHDGNLFFIPNELEPRDDVQFGMCDNKHLALVIHRRSMVIKGWCSQCNDSKLHNQKTDCSILTEAYAAAYQEQFEHNINTLPTTLGRWKNASKIS